MAGLLSLNLSASADTLTFPEGDVHASGTLGKVIVTHDAEGYSIVKDGTSHSVQSYNVDASIRDLTNDQLSQALGKIYLTVTGDEEAPVIHSSVRGLGGGPLTGWLFGQSAAATGAGIGAFFGPIGAVVGGAIGGIVGAVGGTVMPTP